MAPINLIIILILVYSYSFSDSLRIITPIIGPVHDVSIDAQNNFKRIFELWRNCDNDSDCISTISKEDLNQIYRLHIYSDVWDVNRGPTSWYEGGGPNKIIASSNLKSNKSIKYDAKRSHDETLKTAWVEGKDDYGIGEYLIFTFRNECPRITKMQIYNGYQKSLLHWKENSRVKKLKVSLNEKPYVILDLVDTMAIQIFQLDTLGRTKDGKDLYMKLEILDVYKGLKYKDVAISEIIFDGIDVY